MKNLVLFLLLLSATIATAQRVDIQRLRPLPGDNTHVLGFVNGRWASISIEDIEYNVDAQQIVPFPFDSTQVLAYSNGKWGPVRIEDIQYSVDATQIKPFPTDSTQVLSYVDGKWGPVSIEDIPFDVSVSQIVPAPADSTKIMGYVNGLWGARSISTITSPSIYSLYPTNSVVLNKTSGNALLFRNNASYPSVNTLGPWVATGNALDIAAYHDPSWRSRSSQRTGNSSMILYNYENCGGCAPALKLSRSRLSGDTVKSVISGDLTGQLVFGSYGPGAQSWDEGFRFVAQIAVTTDSVSTTQQYSSMSIRTSPIGNTGSYNGEVAMRIGILRDIRFPWYGTGARTATAFTKTDSGYVAKFATDGTMLEDTGARWFSGTGSPEGVITAPVGALYTRTDGGAGTTLYVKESGTGNTGWIAK